MKSAIILASAGVVLGQAITADIAAISSAAAALNSQVSGFSAIAQASAIVGQSQQIVSLINKGASDATAAGMISTGDVTNLLGPFQSLQSVVQAVVNNLVGRKAVATSLTLGNVVEAQLASQLTAAQAFASAVEAQLPPLFSSIGASLAGAILSDLSSGSAAFSGLSGPSTLGGATGPSSASASTSASSAVSTMSSAASTAVSTMSSAVSTAVVMTSSMATTGASTSSAPKSTGTVTPSNNANKAAAGFLGMAAAAVVGMAAL